MTVKDIFSNLATDLIGITGVVLIVALAVIASKGFERNKGNNIKIHAVYAIFTALCVIFIPVQAKDILFTQLSVVVVGTVFPLYESLRAVCTVGSTDDTVWLTYWVVQGIVSFSTVWIDGFERKFTLHWNMFELFFYLWLFLPWTDGATLIFDKVIKPFIEPFVQPMVNKMDGIINKIIALATNAGHLGALWFIFEFLDPSLKKAVWIMIGTAYPIFSSIVCVTSPDDRDDRYWLTYWSTFGTLYILADFVDHFLGFIPGFYTIMIAGTVYLMLPMFGGAEQVRPRILLKFHFVFMHGIIF